MQAAREPRELDLLLVEAEPRSDPRREVGHARGVAARVRVPEVDRLRQARRCAEAGRAVGPGRELPQLGELDDVRPVHVDAVLAVLLRPVERAVREADQLAAVGRLARERGDAGGDGHGADRVQTEVRDPLDDRLGRGDRLALVVLGQEQRELVAAEPESLAVLPQGRREAGENTVAGRVAEEIVDALEVVHVDEAEAEALAVALGLDQLALEPIVEMPVVAEPGQRIGQREPHRAQGAVGRALVERDREQRADERGREERRALPEHDEHQRRRRHQREDHDRPAQALADQREERPPRRDRDDERNQDQVDAVLGRCRDADLGGQGVGPVSGDEADEEAADGRRACEDGSVVGDPDERPVLGQLDENRCREGHQDAGIPAEEHDRTGREDERERDAAAVRALDGDRVAAGEGRGGEERRDAEEQRCGMADSVANEYAA